MSRSRSNLALIGLISSCGVVWLFGEENPTFDAKAAKRFAKLALACVGKEYPNKISHVVEQ